MHLGLTQVFQGTSTAVLFTTISCGRVLPFAPSPLQDGTEPDETLFSLSELLVRPMAAERFQGWSQACMVQQRIGE
jgi:hypothetical protein